MRDVRIAVHNHLSMTEACPRPRVADSSRPPENTRIGCGQGVTDGGMERNPMKRFLVTLDGGVAIELIRSATNDLLGLGRVRVGGVELRDGTLPATIRLDTPDGILYPRLELLGVTRTKTGATVRLRAHGLNWGQQVYCDEYEQHQIEPAISHEPVADELAIHFHPERLALGGREWVGFSYVFHFRSRARKICWLRFHASWEIGGAVERNVVLHQGQCNLPVYRGARRTLFTTSCLKTLDQYGSPQGVSYQLAPRGGLLQAFDFQYAPPGALLMYWPRFDSISSLIESPAGSSRLLVVDEYRFALSASVRTVPKRVLFAKGAVAEHEARNLWFAAYEQVHGGICKQFRVTPSRIVPQAAHNKYRFVMKKDRPHMTVGARTVPCAEWLYALAEYSLPRLAQQGIRRIFPEPIHHSDVTEIGMRRKLDDGIHGGLFCASVCGSHRFWPSEFWGGMKAWRYFYETGRKLGIEIGHWWSPHLSPRAPILAEHPEYRMIAPSSLPTGGGYGENVLNVCDWHTGIFQWMKNDIGRWKEEGGLDFLFVDSWTNLGLLQQNYAARMRTNFSPLGRLFHDFQRIGVRGLQFEGISPFGVSYFGVADLRVYRRHTLGGVVGQNDFDWWIGLEDMAMNLCLFVEPRGRSAEDLRRIQFRAMANLGYMLFANQYDEHFRLPPWWARINHVYNRVLPHMQQRSILPDGGGVRWSDGTTDVLWLFRDYELPVKDARSVERVEPGGCVCIEPSDKTRLRAWNVYRLGGR
jgi:hypothetical protein